MTLTNEKEEELRQLLDISEDLTRFRRHVGPSTASFEHQDRAWITEASFTLINIVQRLEAIEDRLGIPRVKREPGDIVPKVLKKSFGIDDE